MCVRGGGSGESGNTDPPFPNFSLRFIIVVSWQQLVAKVVGRRRVTNLTETLPHNPPHGELRLTGLSASGVSSARWTSSCLDSCVSPKWPTTFVTGTLGQFPLLGMKGQAVLSFARRVWGEGDRGALLGSIIRSGAGYGHFEKAAVASRQRQAAAIALRAACSDL